MMLAVQEMDVKSKAGGEIFIVRRGQAWKEEVGKLPKEGGQPFTPP